MNSNMAASIRALSLFVILYSAASPHAQETCPSGTVCVNGKRSIQEYDRWANDPYGEFGSGGGGGEGSGASGDAGGEGDANNANPSHVMEAAKAFESFEPPCQKAGKSPSSYVARTLVECVNHVKERLTIVPILTTKAAVATEACRPGIANWNVSAVLQEKLCKS